MKGGVIVSRRYASREDGGERLLKGAGHRVVARVAIGQFADLRLVPVLHAGIVPDHPGHVIQDFRFAAPDKDVLEDIPVRLLHGRGREDGGHLGCDVLDDELPALAVLVNGHALQFLVGLHGVEKVFKLHGCSSSLPVRALPSLLPRAGMNAPQ